MPIAIEPRGRGRPKTHPVDRLRARLWFQALREISGLRSAYALEMALDGDRVRKRDADVARPRKWDAYQKGTKVPADVPGPRNSIDLAEARFPGAARWFRSPLWSCLKGELLDARQFESGLRTLTPEVSTLLFEAEPRHPELHPRQRAFDDDAANSLIALGSFDALVAAVLLAGLSQAIASPELRRRALFVYGELQARLKRLPEMEGIYPELFTLVDLCCKHWVYLSDNQRLDVVIFWQGYQAKVDHQGSES